MRSVQELIEVTLVGLIPKRPSFVNMSCFKLNLASYITGVYLEEGYYCLISLL